MTDVGPPPRRVVATPFARARARQLGVDLTTVAGSGPEGRVLGRDVSHTPSRMEWSQQARARLIEKLEQRRTGQLMYRATTVDVTGIHERWSEHPHLHTWEDFLAGAVIASLTRTSLLDKLADVGPSASADPPQLAAGVTADTARGPVVGCLPPSIVDAAHGADAVARLISRLRDGKVHVGDLARPALVLHVDSSRNELETPLMLAHPTPTLWVGNSRICAAPSGQHAKGVQVVTLRLGFDLAALGDVTASEVLDAVAAHMTST